MKQDDEAEPVLLLISHHLGFGANHLGQNMAAEVKNRVVAASLSTHQQQYRSVTGLDYNTYCARARHHSSNGMGYLHSSKH